MIRSIRYGKYKIGVEYTHLKDCYGLYDPNNKKLQIDKRQKGFKLFNINNIDRINNLNAINSNTKRKQHE